MAANVEEFYRKYVAFLHEMEASLTRKYGEEKAKRLIARLDRAQFERAWSNQSFRNTMQSKIESGYAAEQERIKVMLSELVAEPRVQSAESAA